MGGEATASASGVRPRAGGIRARLQHKTWRSCCYKSRYFIETYFQAMQKSVTLFFFGHTRGNDRVFAARALLNSYVTAWEKCQRNLHRCRLYLRFIYPFE